MKAHLSLAAVAAACSLAFAGPAHAHLVTYTGTFAPEAVGATGTGTLMLEYDEHVHTLTIVANWSGLTGNTNNAHIHCCTASPNTGTAGVALAQGGLLPGFPLGVQFGSYSRVIDLTQSDQYSNGFVITSGGTAALAETRLMANLASGNAYFNIHSTRFPGGEIRAFVTATAVPEPGSLALVLAAAGAAVAVSRKRKVD